MDRASQHGLASLFTTTPLRDRPTQTFTSDGERGRLRAKRSQGFQSLKGTSDVTRMYTIDGSPPASDMGDIPFDEVRVQRDIHVNPIHRV